MADERKVGVSFSFSKRKPSTKAYSSEKNALNKNDAKVEEEEKDYIHSAEGKEFKRLVQIIFVLSNSCVKMFPSELIKFKFKQARFK